MTMPITINSKIILSGAAIFAAAALIIGATFAFFSDTETSAGNALQAGALDLKIDSQAHYAGLICQGNPTLWADDPTGVVEPTTRPELIGQPCEGTFALQDLGDEGDPFFELSDIKPGDSGENTISLHVFDNDAWGRIRVTGIQDKDIDCTEPESEDSPDPECSSNGVPGDGELAQNLNFFLWLDEGTVPGFQCANPTQATPAPSPAPAPCGQVDPTEGDNVFNGSETVTVAESVFQNEDDIVINLAPALTEASQDVACENLNGTGHYNYGPCHGLADDGRLVGSATYYIGVAWCLGAVTQSGCDGASVGNEVQTDSIVADIVFEITQQRNQDNPYVGP